MPQIEEINHMMASKDKIMRLKNETAKDEVLQDVKTVT